MSAKRRKGRGVALFDLVAIYWHDTKGVRGWHEPKDIAGFDAPVFVTYGVLLRRDKGIVAVAGTAPSPGIADAPCFNDVSVIPAGCVTKIERMR